ncbi:ACT domain-containing protein [Flagellimonas sp. HMM57]|uniref:ACT domain-containing protein n=1 Tax=unclassified Flagellimonas TaxID=2644544 RepID=UPI0013D09652|nr:MULTISPECIES: ACT domain-containing protein [unclassified Flagellimonas]UII74654.1 ACT domain-containing protein [Flagellimonas sp. HMM57]
MSGETNLSKLLSNMEPVLHKNRYVFVTVPHSYEIDFSIVHGTFKEDEGVTLVLKKEHADRSNLTYDFVASCITLTVHSALHAIGLTSAISTALANDKISCNVIAAYYHDHIFVEEKDAEKAIKVLLKLTNAYNLKK